MTAQWQQNRFTRSDQTKEVDSVMNMSNTPHSKPPIFIIGNPRSGTTLLRLMVANHSNIVVPPECGFAVWLYLKYKAWKPKTAQAYKHLLRDIIRCRKFETWGLSYEQLQRFFVSKLPQSYPDAVSAVYECYGRTHHFPFHRWGDKNNFYLSHIRDINAMFPDAIFIHIVRDGRNVACSYRSVMSRDIESKYAPKLPVEIHNIAEEWHNNITRINSSLKKIGTDRVCQVKLEDLKQESELTLRRVCNKIGEPYDPAMLDYHIENRIKQLEPKEFLQWKEDTVKPVIQSADIRYRSELSRDEINIFNSIARTSLSKYGYL